LSIVSGVKKRHDRTPASIIISSSGGVNARWNGVSLRGFFDGRNLHIDGMDFIVKQRGEGYETILRSDGGEPCIFSQATLLIIMFHLAYNNIIMS
jgi:hypothetical protein